MPSLKVKGYVKVKGQGRRVKAVARLLPGGRLVDLLFHTFVAATTKVRSSFEHFERIVQYRQWNGASKSTTHPARLARAWADHNLFADQRPRPYSPNETSPDISAVPAVPVNS